MSEPLHAHAWGRFATAAAADPLLDTALDTATGSGAEHVDVRLVECEEHRAYLESSSDPDSRHERTCGIGVRVLVDGTWGFASSPVGDDSDVRTVATRAVAAARAANGGARVRLAPRASSSGSWSVPVGTDPFAVPVEEKWALLQDVVRTSQVAPEIVHSVAGLNAKRQHKHYADSGGSRQHQHLMETGAMNQVAAAGHGTVQRRSYPNSFHGNTSAAGWEYVRELDLLTHADRIGREAVELLTAPRADPGRADLVIGPAQMALQIHESVGHALELDRILGDEANFAGRSWVTPDVIGSLRYGSEAVTVVADPTKPGTRGTFAWDDEGTPAERSVLIDRGIVRGVLGSRDAVARAGASSPGAARADGWGYTPVCFATNVYLEPGAGSLDDLLGRLGDGYLLDDNRSWSIDERRLNFQFGTEVAWEVRKGRKGRLLRGFSYGGVTPEFWGSVEAVAGPEEYRAFGMPCGKGEPKQWGFLGHGAAPTLVRDVAIGVAG
ncbi:TldD/PmbA family protein [Jatrophihabitans sp. YIM 134969]